LGDDRSPLPDVVDADGSLGEPDRKQHPCGGCATRAASAARERLHQRHAGRSLTGHAGAQSERDRVAVGTWRQACRQACCQGCCQAWSPTIPPPRVHRAIMPGGRATNTTGRPCMHVGDHVW
jgi:hypothetical protein